MFKNIVLITGHEGSGKKRLARQLRQHMKIGIVESDIRNTDGLIQALSASPPFTAIPLKLVNSGIVTLLGSLSDTHKHKIAITQIIHLACDTDIILHRLKTTVQNFPTPEAITQQQDEEKRLALRLSATHSVPFLSLDTSMGYDVEHVLNFVRENAGFASKAS